MTALEIHVFHCGQGDTLLLRLDGAKWMLLDCNLPGDAVEWFVGWLAEHCVERLDLVCLSHPDRDHYTGMGRVLEYFSQSPRTLGVFCDAGFAVKLARTDSPVPPGPELVELYRRVVRLTKSGQLKYLQVAAHQDTGAESSEWPPQVSVLSPLGSRVQFANLEALTGEGHQAANEYSLVLLVESGGEAGDFRGLLPGDANGRTLTAALARFRNADAGKPFDFVKVSHHGSWLSHQGSPVCGCIRTPDDSVAVICSSRTSRKLPRREVINDYLSARWRVYDTGRRKEPDFGATLFNLVAWPDSLESIYDISVYWTPSQGLSAFPEMARVAVEDVCLYPSRTDTNS